MEKVSKMLQIKVQRTQFRKPEVIYTGFQLFSIIYTANDVRRYGTCKDRTPLQNSRRIDCFFPKKNRLRWKKVQRTVKFANFQV